MGRFKLKRVVGISAGVVLVAVVTVVAVVHLKFSTAWSKTYAVPSFTIAEQVKTADVALGRRIYHVRSGCVDWKLQGWISAVGDLDQA